MMLKNALIVAGAVVALAGAAQGQFDLRVFHGSPDAPAVDVLANGGVAFGNLSFNEITSYATLPDGSYDIDITPAGQNETIVLGIPGLNLAGPGAFTAAALGTLGGDDFFVQLFQDDNTLDANAARIRVIHGSPDAPAVDITLADGTVLIGGLSFSEASSYLSVPGGAYDLQVRLAGSETVVLSLNDLLVDNGTVYTVFATGFVQPPQGNDNGFGVFVSVDAVIPSPGVAGVLAMGLLAGARRRRTA